MLQRVLHRSPSANCVLWQEGNHWSILTASTTPALGASWLSLACQLLLLGTFVGTNAAFSEFMPKGKGQLSCPEEAGHTEAKPEAF